jgi:hypothetical protein
VKSPRQSLVRQSRVRQSFVRQSLVRHSRVRRRGRSGASNLSGIKMISHLPPVSSDFTPLAPTDIRQYRDQQPPPALIPTVTRNRLLMPALIPGGSVMKKFPELRSLEIGNWPPLMNS